MRRVLTKHSDAHELLSSPTAEVEGYHFSYRGILSIWEGFLPIQTPYSTHATPHMPHRSLLLEVASPGPMTNLTPDSHRTRLGLKRPGTANKGPLEAGVSEEYIAAVTTLVARKESSGKATWKPAAATAKVPQRQLALYLCGWSLAEDDLSHAIKKFVQCSITSTKDR